MLTAEIVARSKHSSSKDLLLHEKLPKPPKGSSKLTSFRATLVVRTHGAVRAESILAPSSACFFFQRRRSCKRCLDHCSATHCQKQHCPSTQLMGFRLHRQQQISSVIDVGRATCTMYTGSTRIHPRSARPPNVGFTSTSTRTRGNSDLCVDDGFCLRLLSVDTSPLAYFSPFPSRTLPRSTRTMTASGQL